MKSGCTQYTFCWKFYDLQYTDYFFGGGGVVSGSSGGLKTTEMTDKTGGP
jgi:hypothetical protein